MIRYPPPQTLVLAAALIASCDKDDQPGQAEPFHATTLKALNVTTDAFESTAARPYTAKECVRGQVDELDVLLCRYETSAAAEKAEAKLTEFVGTAVTGAVRRSASLLIAVADRSKHDLKGRRINDLLQRFAKVAPASEPKNEG